MLSSSLASCSQKNLFFFGVLLNDSIIFFIAFLQSGSLAAFEDQKHLPVGLDFVQKSHFFISKSPIN